MQNQAKFATKPYLNFHSKEQDIIHCLLEKIDFGKLIISEEHSAETVYLGKNPGTSAAMTIHDARTYSLILERGDIGLAEAYIQGWWTTNSIDNLIQFGIQNSSVLKNALYGSWSKILLYKVKHWLNANTKERSKINISKHYDLGNDFYSEWLDPSMTYSSAYWRRNMQSDLENAQQAKYQRLLDLISPCPGDHILEIGCGWGGFAEYAGKLGFKVTAITISKKQFEYAQNRINRLGLNNVVKIELLDYREIQGKFDHAVSIEMIEAVGKEYWSTYFKTIKNAIRPGGRVAIQSITMNNRDFKNYLKGTDFIQQYIFPGGVLLSSDLLLKHVARINGSEVDLECFGDDYARTIRIWSDNFQQKWSRISELGYDRQFKKMWEFYLGYCEGAFRSKKIDVVFLSFKV